MNEGSFYPAHCQQCGLYRSSTSWKIPCEADSRPIPGLWNHRPLLVVGQGPGSSEDLMAKPYCGPSGEFLREYTSRLEVPVILDSVTRCFPGRDEGGYDKAPEDWQVALCSEAYLSETIQEYNPAAIVCLGVQAMKAVLGDAAPSSIAKAGKAPIKFRGLPDTWVFCTYLPVNHLTERKDLRSDYLAIFEQAEKFCMMSEVRGPELNWDVKRDLILDPQKAMQRLDRITASKVYYDVETRATSAAWDRLTIWHPGFQMLCASFSFVNSPGNYETFVVAGPALCPEVVTKALRGRTVAGHNINYDLQATWIWFGLDIYELAGAIEDTLFESYLPDQSNFNNSLKQLCQNHLMVRPWEHEVWQQVDAANEKISAYNRSLTAINRNRRKEGLEPLEKRPMDADFSDVHLHDLTKYCAHDTFYNARLKYEFLDRRPPEQMPHPLALQLIYRSMHPIARVERQGMPIRSDRMEAMKGAHSDKIEQMTDILCAQPEVQAAISEIRSQGRYDGKIPDRDLLNVKSPKFFPALLAATGRSIDKKTKTGAISTDKGVLKELAKITKREDEVVRDRADWIWYYFYHIRQSRDMVSKFIDQFARYDVNGRAHTQFKLAKVEVPGRASGADDIGGGATTGRMASANPQCHNIKKDVALRSCFGFEDEGEFAIVETDYDRIEPVCLTVLCGCAAWKEAFASGLDLYKFIATKIPSLGYSHVDQVTKADRDLIKTHTLAVMYDESPQSFASDIGIPVAEAKDFYDEFYRAFPEILAWKQEVKRQVIRGEMVTTIFGRKKSFGLRHPEKDWEYLVDLENLDLDRLGPLAHQNLKILRQSVNFPVQGMASDLTMWKLADVFSWIDQNHFNDHCMPFNIVHDALWFEMRRSRIAEFIPDIIRIMEDCSNLPISFPIPLGVTLKVGTNLGYMMEVDKKSIPAFLQDPERFIVAAQQGVKDAKGMA